MSLWLVPFNSRYPLVDHASTEATLQSPIAPDNRNITSFDVANATYADSSIVASLQHTLCKIFDFCEIADSEELCTNLSKFETIRRVDAQRSTVMSVGIAYSHIQHGWYRAIVD